MQDYQNDRNLLRPFNEELAKAGEPICLSHFKDEVTFIGVAPDGAVAFQCEGENGFDHKYNLYMKPLGWVEGRPVYKEDVLYWNVRAGTCVGSKFVAKAHSQYGIGGFSYTTDGCAYEEEGYYMLESCLTWTKPKRKETRTIWVNVYPDFTTVYNTKEEADDYAAHSQRIACVETIVEYEV